MENQLVVFKLASENYGVDIAAVEGIIKMQTITKMPHTPAFVEGVTNLRGAVLPVVDMRKRFGLAAHEETKDTRIIVVEMDGLTVGVIVDSVNEVLRVPIDDIEPPSPMVTTVDSAFVTGIAKVADRLIILLDLRKVLSVQEQKALQKMPTV
ncbi:MAG: Chemotaxis protein CheW [Anaerolineae bacterium]|nr:Chemotaxis protein CheW [Anaerolineae bacterium]